MASLSFLLKSDLPVAREHAKALLEDGARIEKPGDDLVALAEELHRGGLIDYSIREYVNCVEPQDRDFPPLNRHCQGRIFLEDGQDEDGDEIRCPRCERPVRPYSLNKLRHGILRTSVRKAGAIAWIRGRLQELSTDVRELGDGAFHVGGFGNLGVVVCIVDTDGRTESRFNTRDYAATNPTYFITINSCVPDGRFLKDEWVHRAALVDLVVGGVDLRKALTETAEQPQPTSVGKADIPVYAKGHVLVQPKEKPHLDRLFTVELRKATLLINDELVINPQAGPRLKLFRILWRQFMEDVSRELGAEDFTAMSMRRLLKAMEDEGHRYSDETSLRKVTNNLQADIETALKRKLGVPISREDIVQTCRMTSQSDTSGGYRLNPSSVTIRPSQGR